jgi:heme exporter protein CcmD
MSLFPDFAEDAVFIWGAYGVVVVALVGLLVGTWMYVRSAKAELSRLRKDASDTDERGA